LTNIVKKAVKKAQQSRCKFLVSAIGFSKKGNIIATASNRPRFSRYGGGIHAEMAVLHKGGNKISTIAICRVIANGTIKPINPCPQCKKVLDRLGIKIIILTENKPKITRKQLEKSN